jgi:hypothetical protein
MDSPDSCMVLYYCICVLFVLPLRIVEEKYDLYEFQGMQENYREFSFVPKTTKLLTFPLILPFFTSRKLTFGSCNSSFRVGKSVVIVQ